MQFFLRHANGQLYPLTAAPARLGRDPANAVRLDDPEASRLHATAWSAGEQCFLQDERSANGTFVNDQRLPAGQPRALRPGDQIRIGQTRLALEARLAAQALNLPAAPAASPANTIVAAPAAGPAFCRRCGAPRRPGKSFCSRCGAAFGPAPAQPPAAKPVPPAAPDNSLHGSLGRLGLRVTGGQLVSFVLAVIGGLIMARILPYVYPVFDPLLTAAFGAGMSSARDGFNSLMMTLITFSTSVGLAVIGGLWAGRPRRKR